MVKLVCLCVCHCLLFSHGLCAGIIHWGMQIVKNQVQDALTFTETTQIQTCNVMIQTCKQGITLTVHEQQMLMSNAFFLVPAMCTLFTPSFQKKRVIPSFP